MCDPATAGLIISAVSGGASVVNNQQAIKRQDKQATRGILAQSKIRREANARVGQEINKTAADTGAAERADALTGFQDAIRSSAGAQDGALDPVAASNPRFAERVAIGKGGVKQRIGDKSQRLSVIDGILRQRLNEGNSQGRVASDLTALGNNSQGQDFLTRLLIAGERPNAAVDILAGIGQGVGSGLALRKPKVKVPAGIPPPAIVDPFIPSPTGTRFG